MIGLSGRTVAATDVVNEKEAQELVDKYSSESNVEEAVKTHASDLLEELHSQEYIETDSVEDLVGDPTESEDTTVRALSTGEGWILKIIVQASDRVELNVDPVEESSHARVNEESGPSILTADKLTSESDSTLQVGTNSHETSDCYSKYDVCYPGVGAGGKIGGGELQCGVIEVHQCPGGCLTHSTGENCLDCESDIVYPCQ